MRHLESMAALLVEADWHMRRRQPAMKARFHWRGVRFQARFDYPGRLCVFLNETGELVARSRLGSPTTPTSLNPKRRP